MSVRPPSSPSSALAREAALGALESEIIAEQASALSRAGRRLEQALADLAGFDAGAPRQRSGRNPPDRPTLLEEARKALWYLVVQREACGFRNAADVLSAYAVPAEVGRGVTHAPMLWRRR